MYTTLNRVPNDKKNILNWLMFFLTLRVLLRCNACSLGALFLTAKPLHTKLRSYLITQAWQ